MQPARSYLVPDIRAASRDLVRQFGFMNHTIAGTRFSPSAVHAVIEVGKSDRLSSKDLCHLLFLEKSTVCRLVKSLVERGEIGEGRSNNDGRVKHLHLTAKGLETLKAIDNHAETQVSRALDHLDEPTRLGILKGLRDYSAALKATRGAEDTSRGPGRINIGTGYRSDLTGRIIEMLIPYMHMHMGFGDAFQTKVAADLAEFITRIEALQNEIWHARMDGKIVGSITIDGDNLGDGLAHLRWFTVDSEIHANGVGKALLARALEFCDKRGFRQTHLWTVKGLDAARSLYERNGFELADEFNGDQWGSNVLEQKFVRNCIPK
jgi:DNA-binding MarR family transcriptional regulator/GNAT superfamily N-acetyltransferase